MKRTKRIGEPSRARGIHAMRVESVTLDPKGTTLNSSTSLAAEREWWARSAAGGAMLRLLGHRAARAVSIQGVGPAFLSYARSDTGFGEFLENELKRPGYSVWRDTTELLPGDDWQRVINEAMDASTHFIILLSPRSIERPEVNRELRAAFRARKPIIPILLEVCEIPAQLRSVNHIDWRETQDFSYSSNFDLLD